MVDDSFQAPGKNRHIEIDQQANSQAGGLEVRQHLGGINRRCFLGGFDFDHYRVLNHQIHSVCRLQLDPLVLDRQMRLPLESHAQLAQLIAETLLVRRLEKPRPQMAVHLNRRTNNLVGQLVLGRSLCGLGF